MNRSVFRVVHNAMLLDAFQRKDRGGGGGDGGNATTLDRIASALQVKNLADAESALKEIAKALGEFVQKAQGELAQGTTLSTETKTALTALMKQHEEAIERIGGLEAKYNRQPNGGEADTAKGLGFDFIESEEYKAIATGKTKRARIEVKSILGNMHTRAIVNATGQNQPLVPDMRVPGVITPALRRLTIRDLLPVGRTSSNLVQYVSENVFTNNAGPQTSGSPSLPSENATKNESDITFTIANAAVATIAHFILASKQVLDDAAMLQSYIEGRLMYGLKLEEEDELLNGDGSAGTLLGILAQAAAYNRSGGGTKLDILRRAQTQVALQEYDLEWYVLNPEAWEEIELTKDSTGRYILARPESLAPPTLWGKPVVPTNSIGRRKWVGANGSQAAQIWDREQAGVELSREDSDNFRKNMVTLLCEERLAFTVYRSAAMVTGEFPDW